MINPRIAGRRAITPHARRRIAGLIVNDGPDTLPATMELKNAGRQPLYQYQVHPGHRDKPDLQLTPTPAATPAGTDARFKCLIPAYSLTVLSHHRLGNRDRGVIGE